MKSPQNKPFLQLTGKLLVHQQKNKRLDKHDGNHISRPHKTAVFLAQSFRPVPNTSKDSAWSRHKTSGTERFFLAQLWSVSTVLQRMWPLALRHNRFPPEFWKFLGEFHQAFGCELLPNKPRCRIKVISIFKSKSDHVLVDFLEIIVQGLIDTTYMTDHDSTTKPFRWNVCLFRLWGRRLQFLPRTLRVDCLDTDVFLGDLQLEPISAKNDCLMEHFTPTLLYLGVLIVLHCLSILSRTTLKKTARIFSLKCCAIFAFEA